MLQRFVWKLLPKTQRTFLLHRMPVIDRQVVNRSMSGNIRFPPAFRERRCLFIHVPKCAGNSVCAALFDDWCPGHLPLYWYEAQFARQYAEAFKFAFVRDPLERAYSAYAFLQGADLPERDGPARALVSTFGSFNEFVMHWLTEENVQRQMHFAPQTSFLVNGLGRLAMDFIGHHENLQQDFATVCRHLGVVASLPVRNVSPRREVPSAYEVASIRTRERIRQVYRRDYELLGYE